MALPSTVLQAVSSIVPLGLLAASGRLRQWSWALAGHRQLYFKGVPSVPGRRGPLRPRSSFLEQPVWATLFWVPMRVKDGPSMQDKTAQWVCPPSRFQVSLDPSS